MLLTMYRHSIYFIFPPSAFSAVVNARIPRTSREDTADVSKMTTGKECLLLIYVMDDILYTISSKSFMQLKRMDGYRVQKVPNRCMIGDFHIIDGKIFFSFYILFASISAVGPGLTISLGHQKSPHPHPTSFT